MTDRAALERAARDASRVSGSLRRNRGRPRGAALLDTRGRIFAAPEMHPLGGVGAPAETAALVTAVLAGARRFRTLVLRGGPSGAEDAGPPSGAALQMLFEFSPRCRVHWGTAKTPMGGAPVSDLLPEAFGPRDLTRARGRAT